MGKSILTWLVLSSLVLLVVAANAAPAAQTLKTGQTTCYSGAGALLASCTGTGQDGAFQTGIPWPVPRFSGAVNGTITDNLTGLMWLQDANDMKTSNPAFDNEVVIPSGTTTNLNILGDGKVSWQRGLDYVALLNSQNHLGYADWRLPNGNELYSLVNIGVANSQAWLQTQGFLNVLSGFEPDYFSSTLLARNPAYQNVVAVDMTIGLVAAVPRFTTTAGAMTLAGVWPVRTATLTAPGALPKTGMVFSFDLNKPPADDGALQTGVAWPSPRFAVQGSTGSETVTDYLTGLVWPKDANTPKHAPCDYLVTQITRTMTWQQALDYVACLNTNAFLTFTDWRLPNRSELASLMNPAQASGLPPDPAIPTKPIFSPIPIFTSASWWSSDTDLTFTNKAWIINPTPLLYGGNAVKTVTNPALLNAVIPVRTAPAPLPALTITAGDASRAYGDPNPVVSAFTASGLVAPDTVTSVTNTIAAAASVTAAAGTTHAITPSNAVFGVGSAARYAITYVSGTLTIIPKAATVTVPGTSVVYDGTPKSATITTTPTPLAVNVTYNGTSPLPVAVGSYNVAAVVADPNYTGNAIGTLDITAPQPVRLSAVPSVFYLLLTSCYAVAQNNDTMQVLSGIVTEPMVNFNNAKTVTLAGGFDPTFTSQTGVTTVKGTITVSQGALVVDRVVIQ